MIEVKAKEVEETINALDDDEVRRNAIFKAIYAGAKALQSDTQSFFKSAMGESASHVSRYIHKPFYEGVTVRGDKAYMEATVAIMKDFRMKFFELGTVERYVKQSGHSDYSRKKKRYVTDTGKSNYRGRIQPKHFFRDARENSGYIMEGVIFRSLDKSLKAILKQ